MIEDNPEEGGMLEEVLRTMGATIAGNSGRDEEDVREDELIDMLEQSLEEDMETFEDNEGLSDAQEQVSHLKVFLRKGLRSHFIAVLFLYPCH